MCCLFFRPFRLFSQHLGLGYMVSSCYKNIQPAVEGSVHDRFALRSLTVMLCSSPFLIEPSRDVTLAFHGW